MIPGLGKHLRKLFYKWALGVGERLLMHQSNSSSFAAAMMVKICKEIKFHFIAYWHRSGAKYTRPLLMLWVLKYLRKIQRSSLLVFSLPQKCQHWCWFTSKWTDTSPHQTLHCACNINICTAITEVRKKSLFSFSHPHPAADSSALELQWWTVTVPQFPFNFAYTRHWLFGQRNMRVE